jgi:hypothetical protein
VASGTTTRYSNQLSYIYQYLSGVEGIEPSMLVPKTRALPLGYTPTGKKGLEPLAFGFGDQCSPIELLSQYKRKQPDLNWQPYACKAYALPIELYSQM